MQKIIDYAGLAEGVRGLVGEVGGWIIEQGRGFDGGCVEHKGPSNLVSYVDRTAEERLCAGLLGLLPDSAFLGEEGGHKGGEGGGNSGLLWVVDPLDGTANFVHGLSPYCISVALMQGPSVVLGVVYELTRGEMFWACEGLEGAYNGGNKIGVSGVGRVESAMILCGVAYDSEGINKAAQDFCGAFMHFNGRVDGLRRLGSAAANLAYVACGRADAFFQRGLSPWDVAGGAYLVAKAGGVVTDYGGGGDYIFGGSVVATNSNINIVFREELCRI